MPGVEVFLNSIKTPGESKVLTKSEEVVLGKKIQDPSTPPAERRKAIDLLVIKNIYLVLKLVHKYKRIAFDFEDLVGYGIIGLFSAAQKYDPTRGIRFASYARHWIKEAVMKAVREYSGVPKIPVYLVKDLWCVTRILSKNDDITDIELAKLSDLDVETVSHLRTLLFKTVQFDPEYIGADMRTPEYQYLQKEKEDIFQTTLATRLTPDEYIVLSHSCELGGCIKMTFAKIEEEFNIRNARKLKASAIQKLGEDDVLRSLYTE